MTTLKHGTSTHSRRSLNTSSPLSDEALTGLTDGTNRPSFYSALIAEDPTQKAVFPNYTSEVAKTDIFTSFAWGGVGMTSLIHGINTHLSDLSTHPVHTGSLFEISSVSYMKGPKQKAVTLRNSLTYCQKLLRNYLNFTKFHEM